MLCHLCVTVLGNFVKHDMQASCFQQGGVTRDTILIKRSVSAEEEQH